MSLRNKIVAAITGATLLGGGVTTVVKHNEGENKLPDGTHLAYQDSAGIWTYCYGETKGAYKGLRVSQSTCDNQLIQSAGEHAKALVGLPESLPDVVLLGSLDMAYNVGVSGFSNSTAKRELVQGDYRAAGQAVLQWKYITLNGKKYDCSIKGNKVCYGLWKRRLWQSKAIGNEFKSVQEAVAALPK